MESTTSVAEQLRQQMPVARQLAYFDHAAVAPLTAPAAAAIAAYAQQASEQGDIPWPVWSGKIQELRSLAARLIGASADEIALVGNTTHGIGLVAEGFPWRSGDNVVVPENEFPSNLLPWQMLQRHGVELRKVSVHPSGVIDLGRLNAAIDGRTRIVSLSWVGFASGYRIELDPVVELVHAKGALLMLDAIQGLGAFPIDVADSQVDFLSADGHKWMLGPEGAGILYIRDQHLDLLQPLGVGWNSLATDFFSPHSSGFKTTAARYEGGSWNMPGLLGLGASLKLLLELQQVDPSGSPIAASILNNSSQLSELLRQSSYRVELPQEENHRSGIVRISWGEPPVPESVLVSARKQCLADGVVLSVRGGRLRVSTHAYNNEQDFHRLLNALNRARAT